MKDAWRSRGISAEAAVAEMGEEREGGHRHVNLEVDRATEALGLEGLGVASLCHDWEVLDDGLADHVEGQVVVHPASSSGGFYKTREINDPPLMSHPMHVGSTKIHGGYVKRAFVLLVRGGVCIGLTRSPPSLSC